ncbi:hypothetical protein HKX48_008293 [Thoreauomyces humboldtii]|nr:hypothetical protein HKX48_008293 [Thoreauomyces humboldtii]
MATIIRELWGAHPAFLKTANRRNLIELIAHTPQHGKGLRVVPTIWHLKGWTDSFYTITDVQLQGDLAHGKVFGKLTWKGDAAQKPEEIRSIHKHNWHLYQPPNEARSLEMKLRIPADAQKA